MHLKVQMPIFRVLKKGLVIGVVVANHHAEAEQLLARKFSDNPDNPKDLTTEIVGLADANISEPCVIMQSIL